MCYNDNMRLNCSIIAENGVGEQAIVAAEVGLRLTLQQLGAQIGVRALRDVGLFPTLPTGQVDARIIGGQPAWDGGGVNVWLTERDLSTVAHGRTMNFIYGLSSNPEGGHVIVSGNRLDVGSKDNPLELMATVAHETGHVVGLVDPSARRYSRRFGFEGHCKNDCTMKASNNIRYVRRGVDRIMRNFETAGFCADCLADLSRSGRTLSRLMAG